LAPFSPHLTDLRLHRGSPSRPRSIQSKVLTLISESGVPVAQTNPSSGECGIKERQPQCFAADLTALLNRLYQQVAE